MREEWREIEVTRMENERVKARDSKQTKRE